MPLIHDLIAMSDEELIDRALTLAARYHTTQATTVRDERGVSLHKRLVDRFYAIRQRRLAERLHVQS